jgi:hypothetical protein
MQTEARAAERRRTATRRDEELRSRLHIFNSPQHVIADVVYAARLNRPDDGAAPADDRPVGTRARLVHRIRQSGCRYATPSRSGYPASPTGEALAIQHEAIRRRRAYTAFSERLRGIACPCVLGLMRRTPGATARRAFACTWNLTRPCVWDLTRPAGAEWLHQMRGRAGTASSTETVARDLACAARLLFRTSSD